MIRAHIILLSITQNIVCMISKCLHVILHSSCMVCDKRFNQQAKTIVLNTIAVTKLKKRKKRNNSTTAATATTKSAQF